ncbi:dystroglycan-like [Dorcoceras hygrometricum]|uniref:Dystroglycan-like n=1 Tax=Dorcoceras hygrometricum TaxID=472368 RepID=A0A2Z7CEN4_9LAMI|nr:dystroglycan-like [Dorcoceras hygrometricum]
MASAYYSNTVHIDFASVLAMENPGMVSVFNALMASGLEGFLGCPTVIYESELVDFFNNGSVRDGLVVSTMNGVPVEISEQLFAETFELPVDGLADLSEMPKDKIFDAKSIVSMSGEPEETADAPPVKKAPRKPAASKKRPAIALAEEPVPKRKRTSKKKSGSSQSTLEIMVVAQEAVPLQMVGPSTGVPAVEEPIEQPAAENAISADQPVDDVIGVVDVTTPDDTDEEIEAERPVFESVAAVEPVVEVGEAAADKDFSFFDDPDTVITQVLHQLDSISDDKDEQRSDKTETWFDRALDEMLYNDSPVVTPSDTNEEMETMVVGVDSGNQPIQTSAEKPVEEMVTVMGDQRTTAVGDQQVGSGDELSKDIETEPVALSADEAMSLEDIFMSIPADVQLPSSGVEITRILFGATIHIPGVTERTWCLARLPKIPAEDKGKELMVEKDPVKGNPVREQLVLIVAEIELLVQLREKVINAVEQFFHSFSRKKLAALQLEDVYTKVAAIRSEQLEFQAKISADLLSLSTQIGDLVDYIRGGDAKKGEGSSSRPQPPPSNVQGQGSGGNPGEGSGPTAVRLTDIADRIREDDRRQMEAERERERQRYLEYTKVYVRCDSGYDGYHETHLIVTVYSEPFLVDWAVKMRIRPPEFETSICDAKYHVSLVGNIVMF